MLKMAALSLLVMLGNTPNLSPEFITNATQVATNALTFADTELAKPAEIPVIIPTTPPMATTPTPTQEASKARLDLLEPSSRDYVANDYKVNPDGTLQAGSVAPNDKNSVDLAAVLYDASGSAIGTSEMRVTVDSGSPTIFFGTGNVRSIYVDGQKIRVPVYNFHYEFKTAGDHMVTFSANGMEKSITLTAK